MGARTLQSALQSIVRRWVGLSNRFAIMVLIGVLVLTVFAVRYTASNLGVNTDTADMISSDLSWRQTYIEYKEAFPVFTDTLLVVIDGPSPEAAQRAATALQNELTQRTDVFQWVYAPGDTEHFRRNGLLYLDIDELEELADRLVAVQPFLARLSREPTVAGFATLLQDALENDTTNGNLATVMRQMAVILANLGTSQQAEPLSWWEMLSGRDAQVGDKRRYLIVKPLLDYSALFPAGDAIEAIRQFAPKDSGGTTMPVRVRVTGGLALSHEELASVSQGMEVAGISALLMVSVVLLVGLRSIRLVVASLTTLLIGLIWTAWFAALAVGHLNLISVAFAVLYIGLGVHYSVHFCLRYQELVLTGRSHLSALERTADDVGRSLVLCAVTTGIGFLAFVPTDFAGVSELGLISGVGMFISLAVTLTVLPALLNVLGASRQTGAPWPVPAPIRAVFGAIIAARKRVLTVTVILGAVAVIIASQAHFDRNPLNLRDPNAESVSTYRDLIDNAESSPWTLSTTVAIEDVPAFVSAFEALTTVDKVVSPFSFVPSEQDDKLFLIEDLGFVLALEEEDVIDDNNVGVSEVQIEALEQLHTVLIDRAPGGQAETDLVTALAQVFPKLHSDDGDTLLVELHTALLDGFSDQRSRLRQALSARPVTFDDLPPDILARWLTPDGEARLEIYPKENLENIDSLIRFVDSARTVDPGVTDSPVIQLESGNVVVAAFREAFALALVLIALLLMLLLRRLRDVSLVLFPLLLAGVFTVAATVLFGIPFNFANVITLPLLLGSGVDNGIHLVHRARVAPPKVGSVLMTSTTRAILVSALTTICSFGNLAHSAHPGTASMGQLLSIGLVLTLICTLIVLPALLTPKSGTTQ